MQMTSLRCSLVLNNFFIKPTFKLPIFPLNRSPSHFVTHRLKNGARLQVSSKLNKNVIFASSKNPLEGSDIVEKMENGRPKVPSFLTILTILARILAIAAVWVIGSLAIWAIGYLVFLLLLQLLYKPT